MKSAPPSGFLRRAERFSGIAGRNDKKYLYVFKNAAQTVQTAFLV